MTLSVNWLTKVISVPKADLTLIQSNPTEIRELNLNTFRLWLKDIEDDEVGMPMLDTHTHNTEVVVGGVTLARVVQMINGYTVTFEDGQYAVNLVGANSNVADVVNVNQVSIRASNSAGLTSAPAVEYASFEGGVWVDVTATTVGTIYPSGTALLPVNNLADAKIIADYRGFNTIYFIGNLDIDVTTDFDGFVFIGQNPVLSTLTISSNANVASCEFSDCKITGTLDGNSIITDAIVEYLNYINGTVKSSGLIGNIDITGGNDAVFVNCWTESHVNQPVFDLNNSGQDLIISNYSGEFSIANLTATQNCNIGIDSGIITLDSTITAGNFYISGVGTLVDESTSVDLLDTNGLLSKETMAEAILDASLTEHVSAGSVGEALNFLLAVEEGRWKVDTTANTLTLWDSASQIVGVYDLKDSSGNPASENVYERVPQ